MKKNYSSMYKPDCCRDFDPLPKDVSCFLPGLLEEYEYLKCRHKQAFTKNQRLHQLAIPRIRTVRYNARCPCPFKNPVEIIRLDGPLYTRTEQLALPNVRKLLHFKAERKKMMANWRILSFNRLIRKSLFSLYSRLYNVQAPQPRIPKYKWTKKDWKVHMRWLRPLAQPKLPPKHFKWPKQLFDPKTMKRYKKLAKPNKHDLPEKPVWVLTKGIKFYDPSERILSLAKAKPPEDPDMYKTLPTKVTDAAKTYKATPRIKELGLAREKRAGESDEKENPFSVAPNALKAKASARIQELAEPKEYENVHIRENPFLISPAALKCKPSPRILELAKPKGG